MPEDFLTVKVQLEETECNSAMHTEPILIKLVCPSTDQTAENEDPDEEVANDSSSSSSSHNTGSCDCNNHNNSNSNFTNKSSTMNDPSRASYAVEQRLQKEQMRQELAKQLDIRLHDIGGPISAEWSAIKQFVSNEIQSNLGDAVRTDVNTLMEHPQLRKLVRRLHSERPDSMTQTDLLDRMTAALLPKIRRNHRQFLDRLNRRVSQMLVQLMHNDQLAAVIDEKQIIENLFKLTSNSDEESSRTV